MANESDFYPPHLNPFLVRLTQAFAPYLMHWLYWVKLEIGQSELQKLSRLQNDRFLLLPNHPTFQDPIVVFALSAKSRQLFYYLAAHETFENPSSMFLISSGFAPLRHLSGSKLCKRFLRWFLQQMGMYSIRRGLADRPSIAQTLDLMNQPCCHLVIFPEGGCSYQNDTVMPFRVGGIQMAFQAMNRLVRQGEEPPNFYAIPISIKYQYTQDTRPVIRATLKRLEKALGLPQQPTQASDYERLRAIDEAILVRIEQEYGFHTFEVNEKPWNERINALKLHVIEECEQQLSLTSTPGDMIRERVYRVQYALRERADDLKSDRMWTVDAVAKAMSRLLNFDAIYDGYVASHPTPERFLDTLTRLEREVFNIDQPPPKGYRRAKIWLGEPINLKEHFEAYRSDRTSVVKQLVLAIQQTVQTNLDRINQVE